MRIDISNLDMLYQSAGQLAPEQRIVFNRMIEYCKGLRKSFNSPKVPRPKPPLIKVHGGAGSGKSKLINDIANWSEFFLRPIFPENPDQPIIIKVAPTGKAASLIGGMTLHSAFHFKFSNEYLSLADKLRDTMRKDLSKLRIVIVDEMSMVKSDLLYQLQRRLQEIKQSEDLFGGVAVLLFGDLMQLQPVRANWIFEAPKDPKFARSHAVQPLWDLFDPYELRQNHRQGSDKQYADLLNRVRFGRQTESDITMLKSRLKVKVTLNALHVFGKRKNVQDLNEQKLNELNHPLKIIKAKVVHPIQKNFKPKISADGFINESPFMETLKLKCDSRVMLTYNTDTSDGLTNGATGQVTGFEEVNGKIQSVFVRFDDEIVGCNALEKVSLLQKKKFPNSVPIRIFKFDFSLGRLSKEHTAKATIYQFPLILAWAITAHKCQGQTVKKPNMLGADLKSVFAAGQAYVILGRVQDISQLSLISFADNCFRVSEKAKEESEKISLNAKNNIRDPWLNYMKNSVKIVSLNVRSLRKHRDAIIADTFFSTGDILCFSETSLNLSEKISLSGFQGIFCSKGKGSGVALYYNMGKLSLANWKSICYEEYQALHADFTSFEIIVVYRSPKFSDSSKKLFSSLKPVLRKRKPIFLVGDFNLGESPDSSPFVAAMQGLCFQQVMKKPTHLFGNTLDHIYTNGLIPFHDVHLQPVYFSDHDAVGAAFPLREQ